MFTNYRAAVSIIGFTFLCFLAKLPGVKIRTTHRMNSETFEALVKMGGGMKKKKKKKGKKVSINLIFFDNF